jgi:hypothetical protein
MGDESLGILGFMIKPGVRRSASGELGQPKPCALFPAIDSEFDLNNRNYYVYRWLPTRCVAEFSYFY